MSETIRDQEDPISEDSSDFKAVNAYSGTWAEFVIPFTWFYLILLALLILIPILIFSFKTPVESVYDWLKTVLPVMSTLGGTIVGYWFSRKDA